MAATALTATISASICVAIRWLALFGVVRDFVVVNTSGWSSADGNLSSYMTDVHR
jgi:hypothetical protein